MVWIEDEEFVASWQGILVGFWKTGIFFVFCFILLFLMCVDHVLEETWQFIIFNILNFKLLYLKNFCVLDFITTKLSVSSINILLFQTNKKIQSIAFRKKKFIVVDID